MDVTPMTAEPTAIDGLVLVTMKQVEDERGVVREFYRESSWLEAGLPTLGPWVQVNITESRRGAIRGLHGEAMSKVVAIASGEAFGAYVDARPDSPSYRQLVTVELRLGLQVVVPNGVCNGFQALSESTQYLYCFDGEWMPGMAGSAINPLDETLDIPWPISLGEGALVSEKDAAAPSFGSLP